MSHDFPEDPFSSIADDFSRQLDHIGTASHPNLDGVDDQDDEDPETPSYHPQLSHNKQQRSNNTSNASNQQPLDQSTPPQQFRRHPPQQVRLIQASFDDICDRQLLYIRGRKVIVTCIDYPLLFWRYIDIETEHQYAQRFLAEGQVNNVTANGQALSAHFYHSTLSAQDMGTLVSTSEFHRSYQATPTIFQIDVDDRRNTMQQVQQLQQQQMQQQQQAWDWPDYGRNDHPGLLDTGDDDDWADFGS